jgi:hypothetical protein
VEKCLSDVSHLQPSLRALLKYGTTTGRTRQAERLSLGETRNWRGSFAVEELQIESRSFGEETVQTFSFSRLYHPVKRGSYSGEECRVSVDGELTTWIGVFQILTNDEFKMW